MILKSSEESIKSVKSPIRALSNHSDEKFGIHDNLML